MTGPPSVGRPADGGWVAWHRPYREPGSPLARRLREVQAQIQTAVGPRPRDGYRVVSICAGQGDDLLGTLGATPGGAGLEVTLVELDPDNARVAQERIDAAGLGWTVIEGDAADPSRYADALPADLVLVCGVFGNISDDDVMATVAALPRFCRPNATVIWTRHRLEPDLTPVIRAAFDRAGFVQAAFTAPADVHWTVGRHRLQVTPPAGPPPGPLFSFTAL